jgi:tetratricopeptide (TPR) repeat protein
MQHPFICEHGHRWELPAGPADATLDGAPPCPTCGAPGRAARANGTTAPTLDSASPEVAAPAGTQVPGYEIVRELGRGGMGVVYLARQVSLGRLVALKMVLSGAHAGERERKRFHAEAGAVAKLKHANIVQIHEIGDVDGRPFFSLEFVDGGSLADRLTGTPLPAREAATLLIPIARAAQAAHDEGIVHRDLKPANVLLADGKQTGPIVDATPMLTDFGLAKSVGSADGPTQSGAILGTPSYMAPEQAQGHSRDVGPPVDIYALGAILYELLTGRPPFRAETPLDTVMQVVTQEPVPPRQLQPKCPRDLETIALKCLQKEPRKRYATAGDLADDVQRFLNGEPIHARPVGPFGRAWRWAKRNKAVAALLAILFIVMSAGLVVTSALLVRAHREHQKAVTQEAAAKTQEAAAKIQEAAAKTQEAAAKAQEARAKANLLRAVDAVNRMMTRVADERLAYVPQFEDERRQILEDAVRFYHEFLEQEANDAQLRRATGRAHLRLGKVFLSLGRYEQARDAFQQAVRIHDQLAADFPSDPDHRNDLALALTHHGGVQRLLNHLELADPDYARARQLAEELVASAPGEPEYHVTLAETLAQLGFHSLQQRRIDAARSSFRKSVEEWGALVDGHPGEFRYAFERAKVRSNLGYLLLNIGDLGEAERFLHAAIAEFEQLRSAHPEQTRGIEPVAAEARLNLAAVFVATNRLARADEPLQRGLKVYERLVANYALMPGYRLTLARGYQTAGMLALARNMSDQAETDLLKATALLEELGRAHPEAFFHGIILRVCWGDLVRLYRQTNRPEKALEIAEKAVKNAREDARAAPKTSIIHIEFPRWVMIQCEVLHELKRDADATPLLKEGLDHARSHLMKEPGADQMLNVMRVALAIALVRVGEYRPALAEADDIINPMPRDQNTVYNVACIYSLVAVAERKDAALDSARRAAQAEEHANRAISLIKQLHRDNYFRPPARAANFWADTDLIPLLARDDFRKWAEDSISRPKKDK